MKAIPWNALCQPALLLLQAGATGVPRAVKDEKEDELEEAKDLFREGLKKIFQATKKVSEKIVEGFREGYAEDVTKKDR
jgi:hypothetical protein